MALLSFHNMPFQQLLALRLFFIPQFVFYWLLEGSCVLLAGIPVPFVRDRSCSFHFFSMMSRYSVVFDSMIRLQDECINLISSCSCTFVVHPRQSAVNSNHCHQICESMTQKRNIVQRYYLRCRRRIQSESRNTSISANNSTLLRPQYLKCINFFKF